MLLNLTGRSNYCLTLSTAIIAQLMKSSWLMLSSLSLSNCLNAQDCLLLSQGDWANLKYSGVPNNCLDFEAMEFLVKGNWPLLRGINLDF